MSRRTTIEIDQDLLLRAKKALGEKTTRAAVEEALRRAAVSAEDESARRTERQRRFLKSLDPRVDQAILRSREMWR